MEFKEKDPILVPTEVEAFHVVFTTHNSRTSARMKKYRVVKGSPFLLTLEQEIVLTQIIGEIIIEKGYKCIAYNVCKDHMHLMMVCKGAELVDIGKTLKGKSSFLLGQRGYKEKGKSLWSQKFYRAFVDVWELIGYTDEPGYKYESTHLSTSLRYIKNNRIKHNLPQSDELEQIIKNFLCTPEVAFGID